MITVIMVTHSSELALKAGTRLKMRQGALERLA
jgi:ABC-type lipoprotein export system ATPase subunit